MKDTIVFVTRFRSESEYVFGPMTPRNAEAFAARVNEHDDAEVTGFAVVNSPALFGTGDELS